MKLGTIELSTALQARLQEAFQEMRALRQELIEVRVQLATLARQLAGSAEPEVTITVSSAYQRYRNTFPTRPYSRVRTALRQLVRTAPDRRLKDITEDDLGELRDVGATTITDFNSWRTSVLNAERLKQESGDEFDDK